jgi:hypothetical protein
VSGQRYCLFHGNPELAKTFGRRGGQGNRHIKLDQGPQEVKPPVTAAAVRDALAKLFADACLGKVEPKVAQVAASLSGDLLKAIQVAGDAEVRITPSATEGQPANAQGVTYGLLSADQWETLFSDFQYSSTSAPTSSRDETAPEPAPTAFSEKMDAGREDSWAGKEQAVESEYVNESDGDRFLEWYRSRHRPAADD